MRELRDIVAAWEELSRLGQRAVLATVVKVDGSAFRGVGARMLVSEDGRTWGGVSGGCLEADIVRRVPEVLESNRPRTLCYDTRSDADIYFGYGLGCNGVIQVLVEPVSLPLCEESSGGSAALSYLREFLAHPEPMVLARVIHSVSENLPLGAIARFSLGQQPGPSCLTSGTRHEAGSGGGFEDEPHRSPLELALFDDVQRVFVEGRTSVRVLQWEEADVEVTLEFLRPPLSMVVFGAGNDAVPLVNMASALGWRVTVMDYRENWATPGRFPGAAAWLQGTTDELIRKLVLDTRTGVVLMSHNYLRDRELLPRLMNSHAGYIGLLGSRNRIGRLLGDLERQGTGCGNDPRLHAPVGLDIGAETPEEIALAVLAEMQAAFAGKSAGPLSARRATRTPVGCLTTTHNA